MHIYAATAADLERCVSCWVVAFAEDPITQFLLGVGPDYPARLTQFFSLLMQARIALGMPVIVARRDTEIVGGAMGYATEPSVWPENLKEQWDQFERTTPGMGERSALYDRIARQSEPGVPHYYLGVIGVHPRLKSRGIGAGLLRSFCDRSASDLSSRGVYLETANPGNVAFYERAGFAVTGEGRLGSARLWCMFLSHALSA